MFEGLFDGLVSWLFGELGDLLRLSSETALQKALDNLYILPTPPLNEDFFQSIYAVTWGLAIVVALVTGAIGTLRLSFGQNQDMSLIRTAGFFVDIIVFGFLLPLIVGVGLQIGGVLTEATLLIPQTDGNVESLMQLNGVFDIADSVLSFFVNLINFLLGWILAIEVMWLTWGILLMLAVAMIMRALAPLGQGGSKLWNWWSAWLLVAVVAKPIISLVLVVGNYFANTVDQLFNVDLLAEVVALATIVIAIDIPLRMKKAFERSVAPSLLPAPLNIRVAGSTEQSQSLIRMSTMATSTGVASAYRFQKESTNDLKSPGRKREVIATGLSAAASKIPNPSAKAVGSAGSVILNRSAKKAKEKNRSTE